HQRALLAIGGTLIVFSITGALWPILISAAIEAVAENEGTNVVLLLIGALLLNALLDYGLNVVRRRLTARVVGESISQMRKDAFAAAINRDMAFYDDNKSGKIVSRITSGTQEFGTV